MSLNFGPQFAYKIDASPANSSVEYEEYVEVPGGNLTMDNTKERISVEEEERILMVYITLTLRISKRQTIRHPLARTSKRHFLDSHHLSTADQLHAQRFRGRTGDTEAESCVKIYG